MEEPGRLQSMGSLELDTTERLHFHFSLSCMGEGNGNPLQCSCLENPRDGGGWWAAISGVAESRTQLKRLSSSSSKTCIRGVAWPFRDTQQKHLFNSRPPETDPHSRADAGLHCVRETGFPRKIQI